MTVLPFTRAQHNGTPTTVDVDIVIPVYNEEGQLAASITALRTFLDTSFPFDATVTIADNASTDGTWRIASELAATLDGVAAIHLDQKGRGRALRAAWSPVRASVVAYMDVDLATGLDALLPLVAPLLSGHSDVAIGTRLGPGAHVVRGTRREFISRAYNLLLRSALRSSCTDAQCGFKAMRRHAAAELLPLVEDDEWFFDTEVLVTAQRIGLRIHEVPVDWVDDTDSRVEVLHTALDGPAWDVAPAGTERRDGVPSADRPIRTRTSTSGATAHTPDRLPIDLGDRWSDRVTELAPGAPSDGQGTASPHDGPGTRSSPTNCSGSPGSGAVSTVAYCSTVRRPRAGPGQLSGQRRGHRPVQSGEHRRPPGHGRHRPPRTRPPAPDGHRGDAAGGQPGLHHRCAGRHPGGRPDLARFPSWWR